MVKGIFQATAASFPLHKDRGSYYYHDGFAADYTRTYFADESCPPADVTMWRSRGNPDGIYPTRTLFRKSFASFQDPICISMVLDALINSQRGTYLRPRAIADYLNQRHFQYFWVPGTVGRIMAGIKGACEEAYFEHGLEEGEYPFARGRDSSGAYYVIDPQNGNEGLLWLVTAFGEALKMAHRVMMAERQGYFFSKDPKVFDGIIGTLYAPKDWYVEWFPEAVRTPEAFRAQLQPGRHFDRPGVIAAYDVKFDGK